MLIGICGKAGSGKDTIGDYLVSKYNFKKIGLADPIKRLVKDIFALDDDIVYDRIKREQPLVNWSEWTVRKLLQFIGTELFREHIDDEIWVKSLWLKIQDDKNNNYVVTDLRFPNEINYLREHSRGKEFLSIKTTRKGYNGNVGLDGHASESYDLDTDIIINNDETIEKLYNKVDLILRENLHV